MSKLRILKWGGKPGLFRWIQCNHKDPCKRKAVGKSQREDIRSKAEVRKERRCYTDGFEDVGREQKPRIIGSFWNMDSF